MRGPRRQHLEGDTRLYLIKTDLGSQHSIAFCQEKRTIDGVSHQCSFQMRTDKLKANLKKGKLHQCSFKPIEDIRTMLQVARTTKANSSDDLVRALASAVGEVNVSLEAMLSEPIRKVIQVAFDLGQTTREPFDSVVKMPTRRVLRATMIEEAKKVDDGKLDHYRESPFVSLSIDEGTTFKKAYLNFILHDVANRRNEYFAKSIVMSGKTTEHYVVSIHFGLEYCQKKSLNVSSIVMDGSKAQAKAFAPSYRRSLRNVRFTTDIAKKVITFPCACHLIENAYKRLLKRNAKANKLITNCRQIGKTLNESASSLPSCPRFVSTRWVYDYDIVRYVIQHRLSVISVVKAPIPKQESLQNMKTLLGVLRTLIANFESTLSSITEVYPAIDATISSLFLWKGFSGSDLTASWENVFSDMATCLKFYFLEKPHSDMLILSYLLTPHGRQAFLDGKHLRYIPPKEFDYREDNVEDDTISQEIDELLMEVEPDMPLPESKKESLLLEAVLDISSSDDDDTMDLLPNTSESNASLAKAYKALRNVCSLVSLNQVNTLKALDAFLEPNNYLIRENLRESIDRRWFNWHHMRTVTGFEELSEIAQRIMPTPASEASAERSISLQRAIILAKRNKAHRDLVRSREILMQASRSNIAALPQKRIFDMIKVMDPPSPTISDEREIARRKR